LRSDGSIIAWGTDKYGYGVLDVPAGNDFVSIVAGGFHNMAVRQDGSIACWGGNAYGQLDLPTNEVYTEIVAGRLHSVALIPEPTILSLLALGAILAGRKKT